MWIRDVTAQGNQQSGNGCPGTLYVDPGPALLLKVKPGKLVGVGVLPFLEVRG